MLYFVSISVPGWRNGSYLGGIAEDDDLCLRWVWARGKGIQKGPMAELWTICDGF
jgi:hypothetical protein